MKTNKWKMSLLVWSAMFPGSTLVTYGLTQLPFTSHWPVVARTFCLTCLLVPFMVCVALPFLTRRFQKWLHHTPQQNHTQSIVSEQSLVDSSDKIQPEPITSSRQKFALL